MKECTMIGTKLCGITSPATIPCINVCMPTYVGFMFYRQSKHFIPQDTAQALKAQLNPHITCVGVFVNAEPTAVAQALECGVCDVAQLHGTEDNTYILALTRLTNKPIIQAFCVKDENTILRANNSIAPMVLLDAGGGSGTCFDWRLLCSVRRPYILAGGLAPHNVYQALCTASSYRAPVAVDVSSGIETNGVKDTTKITAFMHEVARFNHEHERAHAGAIASGRANAHVNEH